MGDGDVCLDELEEDDEAALACLVCAFGGADSADGADQKRRAQILEFTRRIVVKKAKERFSKGPRGSGSG